MVDMMYLQLMGVVKCHRPTLVDHVVACRSLLIRGFELSWASPLLDAFAFKVWRMSKPTHVRWTQKECKRLLGAVVMCRENGKSKSTKPIQKKQPQEEISQKKKSYKSRSQRPNSSIFLGFFQKMSYPWLPLKIECQNGKSFDFPAINKNNHAFIVIRIMGFSRGRGTTGAEHRPWPPFCAISVI